MGFVSLFLWPQTSICFGLGINQSALVSNTSWPLGGERAHRSTVSVSSIPESEKGAEIRIRPGPRSAVPSDHVKTEEVEEEEEERPKMYVEFDVGV